MNCARNKPGPSIEFRGALEVTVAFSTAMLVGYGRELVRRRVRAKCVAPQLPIILVPRPLDPAVGNFQAGRLLAFAKESRPVSKHTSFGKIFVPRFLHAMRSLHCILIPLTLSLFVAGLPAAESAASGNFKGKVRDDVEAMRKQTQVMIDMVFSFGELGFQEVETSKYLTGVLEREGFTIERGIAGMPTAWMASWGSGKPVIALGADIDCIPQASQKPGVGYRDPLVEGAPGHGEGHNAGQPLNLTSAIAVKRLMEREKLSGTIKLWPGVAEEQLAGKAHLVRAGYFKDVDVVIFTHVGNNLQVSWGTGPNTGLVSVEYLFKGESAHSAGAPWQGRSALDAVELMNVGWNYRREHLRLQHRSHYVVTNGGDQPNVVPSNASVWYFFRELDYSRIRGLHEIGNTISQAAAMMTNTTVSSRVLGSAWPGHFNKAVAEAMDENIKEIGLPKWSDEDQTLAKALQLELKGPAKIGRASCR